MTRDEVKEVFKIIANVYPQFTVTSEKLNMWHDLMSDQNLEDVKKKTRDHVLTQKFPPTIAELRTEHFKKSRDQIKHEQMLKENGLL